MHQICFPLWLRPRSRWRSSQRFPDPIAVFKGPTSKGRERKRKGGEGKGKVKGKEVKTRLRRYLVHPKILA